MPKTQKMKMKRQVTLTQAKPQVVLAGDARAQYEAAREKSRKRHKALTESIRASQLLSKEDFDIRINTRD